VLHIIGRRNDLVSKEELDFIGKIQLLVEKVKQNQDKITNEEATKQFLILDFIEALGYNTRVPAEFIPEYGADYGEKKGTKVDYAILKEGVPIVFIEAKPINKVLQDHDSQLEYYFGTSKTAKLGILTNGNDYRFFTDYDEPNRMDKRPFLKIRLSEFKKSDIDNLKKLIKENYTEDNRKIIAEELYYATEINSLLKDLLTNPPDDFIKDLIKKIKPDKKITAPFLERLKPIVRIAITNTISELTRIGIEDQQKKVLDDEIREKQVKSLTDKVISIPSEIEKTIEITEEEKKSFEIVKSILQKSGRDISKLNYKDTINYLSINNRVTTGWFLRMILRDNKKSFDIRVETPNIDTLTKGFEIKKYPNSGVINIIITSIDDLKKLDKLIIACFDEVNK
jgi:hypothetical protein